MTGGGQPCGEMDVLEKLTILTDAAKYDAACTSSGGNRRAKAGYIGNTTSSIAGCCHSFSADGRCVTLLKVLMTNRCVYDCKYCVNRRSNEAKAGHVHPGGAGGPHHPVLPPELHRGAVPLLRRVPLPGLYHGTDDPGAADLAGRVPLQRLHPRQGHPRHGAGAGGTDGVPGGPAQRQYRAAVRGGTSDPGPGQDEAGHPGSYGADSGAGDSRAGRSW